MGDTNDEGAGLAGPGAFNSNPTRQGLGNQGVTPWLVLQYVHATASSSPTGRL